MHDEAGCGGSRIRVARAHEDEHVRSRLEHDLGTRTGDCSPGRDPDSLGFTPAEVAAEFETSTSWVSDRLAEPRDELFKVGTGVGTARAFPASTARLAHVTMRFSCRQAEENGRTWDRTRDLPRVKRALSR
jgi:hypothetical protein